MRSESDAEFEAIDEAIRIGKEARIPVQIWHLKASGKNNWGRMREIVGPYRKRACERSRYRGQYLRVSRVVQQFLGIYSAVGA